MTASTLPIVTVFHTEHGIVIGITPPGSDITHTAVLPIDFVLDDLLPAMMAAINAHAALADELESFGDANPEDFDDPKPENGR